jgi:hypothetical protein
MSCWGVDELGQLTGAIAAIAHSWVPTPSGREYGDEHAEQASTMVA